MKPGFVRSETPSGSLIGLGGKLRAGKDEVANYLAEKHGYAVMGMSDALNEALLKLNPILWTQEVNGEYVETRYQRLYDAVGYVEAKKNPEVRRLLQVLGTEVGRDMIDPDVWVKIAEKKIREHWAEGRSVVITAMRFPNEIEMLNRLGGTSIWIDRPEEKRWEGMAGTEATPGHPMQIVQHASETSVGPEMFWAEVVNDDTLEELYARVEDVIPRDNTITVHRLNRSGITADMIRAVDPVRATEDFMGQPVMNENFHPPYDR